MTFENVNHEDFMKLISSFENAEADLFYEIKRYFKILEPYALFQIFDLVSDFENAELFERVRKSFANIEVDITGSFDPEESAKIWELTLENLEHVFLMAVETLKILPKDNISKQVVLAKTLKWFETVNTNDLKDYRVERVLLTKKGDEYQEIVEELDDILLLLEKNNISNPYAFVSLLLEYVNSRSKEKSQTFLKNFRRRLDVASKDTSFKYQESTEIINKVESLIKRIDS